MRRMSLALAAAAALAMLGCVITTRHTIDAHITVDIRHIEKQADDVLDFIEGKTDTPPAVTAPPAHSRLRDMLQLLSPMRTAWAQELKATSPKVTELAASMKKRFPEIEALKKGGCLGESNRGYVELRPCDKLNDAAARNEAQKLVAAENADRKALYREIADLNQGQNVSVGLVERVYAQKRLERARPGEVFQLPPEGKDFEAFRSSATGKKLGDAAKPDAWVEIP